MVCSTEMLNVAVLPVPDCACAMTSTETTHRERNRWRETQPRMIEWDDDPEIACRPTSAASAGDNGTLLDGRRLLKAVGVDSAQQVLAQVHVIETAFDDHHA